ncbi:MAG: YHS domain-containing (seleno)protein [Flavobacteriaceae bacterium]
MKKLLISLCVTLLSLPFYSQEAYNAKDGIAIDGYDVVSYFEGIAAKGSAEFTSDFEGVTFWFASEDHRMEFEKAPLKYAPQYGGYCAYAMGKSGEKVSINPTSFLITEGKLYLFYHRWGVNTLKKWKKEGPESLRVKADENWKKQQ